MANLYGLQEGVAEELGSFMSIAVEVSYRRHVYIINSP